MIEPVRVHTHSPGRKLGVFALSLAGTLLLGWIDFATGIEVAISAFYLLPICATVWFAGRPAGIVMALACAAVQLFTGHTLHPRLGIVYWNTAMLLLLFLFVIWLLHAFHHSHLNLEKTVTERTAALRAEIAERQRLEAANLQAERMAVVGLMAAEVAHEIRNPLGSIVLNLDFIESGITQPDLSSISERQLLLGEVRAEIRRIQRVLEDYLRFSRPRVPQLQPLTLNHWLEDRLAFISGDFEKAAITLIKRFDPSLPTVEADPDQLWQALLNLIRNGIESMASGGELALQTTHNGVTVSICVTDRGAGMTAEQMQQIFEPFSTTKASGTGLGLALVRQILTEHGGLVSCASAHGVGSTFTVSLPVPPSSI